MKLTLTWTSSTSGSGAASRTNTFLTTTAVFITILTPVASAVLFFLTGSASFPAILLAVYVCLLASTLLILLMTQEMRSAREIRYASATTPLRKTYGCLANASWTVIEGDGSEEAFTQHLRHALQFFAEAFSHITDKPCRASIKMTTWPNHGAATSDVRVYTLCRSDDEGPELASRYDQISNNTDFKQIFEENAAYFLCNDLPSEIGRGYQNSHWDAATIQSQSFKYRATIVWPISRARARMAPPSEEREVIGFLCVDTLATNAFNETYDVPIGMAFAGGLHLALNRFRARQAASGRDTAHRSH